MTKNTKGKQHRSDKPEMPKDLVKKEYTSEEKARIAKYFERVKRKPVKFTKFDKESNALVLEIHEGDQELVATQMLEAFGTPDTD